MFKGFIFDLDGTVYSGDRLISGADRLISRIRKKGGRVVFISNNTIQTREDCAKKLTSLGIPTKSDEIINPTLAIGRYLKRNASDAKLFVIGESTIIEELRRDGFIMTEDPKEIQYVVIAFDRAFDYQKLKIAHQAIKGGARFAVINTDQTCPVEVELLNFKETISAIETLTQKKLEIALGKPSSFIIKIALEKMDLSPFECIIIGDSIYEDIKMGKEAGIATGVVLTGITDEETLKKYRHSNLQPDFVFKSIAEVENLLL